jgi:hypothetical protein
MCRVMPRNALRVIGALSCVVALFAACAGAGNGSVQSGHTPPPLRETPDATSADVSVMRARPPPPTSSDDFPAWPVHAQRIDQFRREGVDSEWAPVTEAAIKEQLAGLSDYVRVRLLECRCGGCMLGFLRWFKLEHTTDEDMPQVRWAGLEQHWNADLERKNHPKYVDGGIEPDQFVRGDGWQEELHFFVRHPRDATSASPRVRSHESPLMDPNCARGSVARPQPGWGFTHTGRGVNTLWFVDRRYHQDVCSCACGKGRLDTPPNRCRDIWSGTDSGYHYCALAPPLTKLGVMRVEGLWSCERSPASADGDDG